MYDENAVSTNEEFHADTCMQGMRKRICIQCRRQAFYKQKGFMNKPKMCKAPETRKKRGREPRQYFETTVLTAVPRKSDIQPSADRPVFAASAFEKEKNVSSNNGFIKNGN